MAPYKERPARVFHDKDGFYVMSDGKRLPIKVTKYTCSQLEKARQLQKAMIKEKRVVPLARERKRVGGRVKIRGVKPGKDERVSLAKVAMGLQKAPINRSKARGAKLLSMKREDLHRTLKRLGEKVKTNESRESLLRKAREIVSIPPNQLLQEMNRRQIENALTKKQIIDELKASDEYKRGDAGKSINELREKLIELQEDVNDIIQFERGRRLRDTLSSAVSTPKSVTNLPTPESVSTPRDERDERTPAGAPEPATPASPVRQARPKPEIRSPVADRAVRRQSEKANARRALDRLKSSGGKLLLDGREISLEDALGRPKDERLRIRRALMPGGRGRKYYLSNNLLTEPERVAIARAIMPDEEEAKITPEESRALETEKGRKKTALSRDRAKAREILPTASIPAGEEAPRADPRGFAPATPPSDVEDEGDEELSLPEEQDEPKQDGQGCDCEGDDQEDPMQGLYETQIEEMLQDIPEYAGVVASNEWDTLPLSMPMSFVSNTKPRGHRGEHWVAIRVDPSSVEYFDPEGQAPDMDMLENITELIKRLKPPTLLKLKVNGIRRQMKGTNSCGLHSANFVMNRSMGIPYATATGYDASHHSEEDVRRKFGYI